MQTRVRHILCLSCALAAVQFLHPSASVQAQTDQQLPECDDQSDWIETEFFNESFSGNGSFAERRVIQGQPQLTGFEQTEWQFVGHIAPDNGHDLAFGDGVIEVRNSGTGVQFDAFAQYTRAGSFVQRIEMQNVELGGPLAGVMAVISLFNVIVGAGDNQLVIQNPGPSSSPSWQAFILNQSALDGAPKSIAAGTDISFDVWFDEPSRTLRYYYDDDTSDAEPAKVLFESIFTGPIDPCHRDQQLAFTSNGSPGNAYAGADVDNWSYRTVYSVPGDFNGDGTVNLADYTVWRNSLGATGTFTTQLPADANGDFIVDELDYFWWRETFGLTTASASQADGYAAVPEPSMTVLLAGGALLLLAVRARS